MLPYIYILKWFVMNRIAFTPVPNIKPNSFLDFFIEPQQRVWLNNWKLAKLLLRQVGPYDIQMTDVDAVSVVRPRDLVMKWQVGAYRTPSPPPNKKKPRKIRGVEGVVVSNITEKITRHRPYQVWKCNFGLFCFFDIRWCQLSRIAIFAIPDNTPSVWILVI